MTFLCTRNGALVDGGGAPWPEPWGFHCDKCGRVLPYGLTISPRDQRQRADQARQVDGHGDRHRCGDCEGFSETRAVVPDAPVQLEMFA